MIRGIASIAKLVTPASASALLVSAGGERRQVADQDLARAQPADLLDGGERDLDHHVGAPGVVARPDAGAGLRVLGVGMAGALAGARLDRDLDLLARQRADGVRDQRHAALALPGLFGHAYPQGGESLFNGGAASDQAGAATPASSARRSTVCRRCSGSGLIGETIRRSTPAAA